MDFAPASGPILVDGGLELQWRSEVAEHGTTGRVRLGTDYGEALAMMLLGHAEPSICIRCG